MKLLRNILTVLCLACAVCTYSAGPSWEVVTTNRPSYETYDPDRIEVTVNNGYIYITTAHPVNVKVLSIVGQLISQQTVSAGVSRLKISQRGIYILKAGAITTRVTV